MGDIKEEDFEETTSNFNFTFARDGTFTGFAMYFDVGFTADFGLSTSPFKPTTHWNQTIFLFDKKTKVEKGTALTGLVHISRNKTYRRHFRVTISCEMGGSSDARTLYGPK